MTKSREVENIVLAPRVADFLNGCSNSSTRFTSENQIKEYIAIFISASASAKKLGYKDVESVYSRICAIQHLNSIVEEPFILMVTLHTLPYLEAFYQDQKAPNIKEVIKKDLYHFITILMISDTAEIIKINEDVVRIFPQRDIQDSILDFYLLIARNMLREPEICEIKEEELSEKSDPSRLQLKKFIFPESNPKLFKDENTYKAAILARENCFLLQKKGSLGSLHYLFVNRSLLDYFGFLIPQCIHGRRKKIATWILNHQLDINLAPHKVNLASLKSILLNYVSKNRGLFEAKRLESLPHDLLDELNELDKSNLTKFKSR